MLTIIWDPDKGMTVPDNRVMHEVARHIDLLGCHAKVVHCVGSEILVNGYRLAVARGDILPEDIQLQFHGKTVTITENSLLEEYPSDMGVNVDILSDILGIRLNGIRGVR